MGIEKSLARQNIMSSSDDINEIKEELEQIDALIQSLKNSGTGLDEILLHAQLTSYIIGNVTLHQKQRTTVRGLINRVKARYDVINGDIYIKKENYEEVERMWTNFLCKKDKLLKEIEKIEEVAESEILIEELEQETIKNILKQYEKLQEQLNTKKYEATALENKGNQIIETDSSQENLVKEHISMIFITMEDSACLIDDKSLLLKNILSHMNEFEQSRDVVSRFLDLAESAATTAEKIPNFSGDDLKRSNTKLELMKKELEEKQPIMDDFDKKGKKLMYIIKNNGFSYTDKFNEQIESLIDRYLDIVDKIDEVLESFDQQLKLWKELQQVDDTIEEWMTVHVEELINNKNSSLDDSATFRQKLSKVEEQLNEKNNLSWMTL